MKKKCQIRHLEGGQVIPVLVIGILVTVLMAALLVDGGMVLSHRRTAQAAADAGALAAAKSLCPGSGATQADARTVAQTFVEDNDAEFILLPDEEQFPEDHTIRVEARAASQAFFSGIFDQVGLAANAVAEANCTLAAGVEGAVMQLPIAFPCLDKQEDENGVITCGNIIPNVMTIVMDSHATKGHCFHPEDNPGGIVCNSITAESSRGWLSLDGGGELKTCWLDGSCPPDIIYPGTWLSARTGVVASFFMDTLQANRNIPFIVGVYDREESFKDEQCKCEEGICVSGDYQGDFCRLRDGNHNAYRIVGFAEFIITCVHGPGHGMVQGSGSLCPFRDYLINNHNVVSQPSLISVEGYFSDGFTSGGGGDGSSGQFIVQLTQ